jgi:hypothetical protein
VDAAEPFHDPVGWGAHPGGHDHGHDTSDGLEWEDLMPEINRASDSTNMIWRLEELGAHYNRRAARGERPPRR